MKTLQVSLAERSYPIYIGSNLLAHSELLKKHINSKQVLIVTNETIAPLYLDAILSELQDYRVETVILPDGEQYKTLEMTAKIFNELFFD